MKKTLIPQNLLSRVEEISEKIQVSPLSFISTALENELARVEEELVREEITMLEIGKNILGRGEELGLEIEPPPEAAAATEVVYCELCKKNEVPPPFPVTGPFFCHSCMELSRGGDFSKISPHAR